MSRTLIVLGIFIHSLALFSQDVEATLLWKISDQNNLSKTSYLFGTIHIIDSENYFIPDTLDKIITEVDEVCFELNISDPMEMMMGLLGLGDKLFLPNDEIIDQYLEKDELIALEAKILETGFPSSLMKRLKPIFISTMLGGGVESMEEGKSYELEIGEIAKVRGKSICGLESLSEQLDVFDKIPLKDQIKQLVESLHSPDNCIEGVLDSLVYFYINQSIGKLDRMIQREFLSSDTDLADAFLKDRNSNWVNIIMQDQLVESSKLYAVGAGHLAGTNGLVNLLRKENLTLTPIYFKWKSNGLN